MRLFCRAKSNIGPDDGGFEYELHQSELNPHPGIFASCVLWGNAVEGVARELLAAADATRGDGEGSALADAKHFLTDLLADGPVPVKTIKENSSGAGHTWATIRRAKDNLGIVAKKEGGRFGEDKQQWVWRLPVGDDRAVCFQADRQKVLKNAEDAQQNSVSTFREFEHLQGETDLVEVEI